MYKTEKSAFLFHFEEVWVVIVMPGLIGWLRESKEATTIASLENPQG